MNDLISRHVAIEAAIKESNIEGAYCYMDTKSIVNMLEGLPSAQPEQECEKCIFRPFKQFQPERKKGRWYDVGSLSCRCSECGCKSPKEYSFCPNCGSKMEVK